MNSRFTLFYNRANFNFQLALSIIFNMATSAVLLKMA